MLIYSLLTRTIENRGKEIIKLDVSKIPGGIYIINLIEKNEKIASKRVVITNN